MSNFGPAQAKFVSALAHETGLNPRVVGAWALAEQSGSAAKNYEDKGYNDFLNIANTDSGPASGAHSTVWHDPLTAARATANWLRGTGQITKEYGAPAPGIRNILNVTHGGPEQQIQAIAHSGWASSGYDGGATLKALYGEVSEKDLPGYTPTPGVTPSGGLPPIGLKSGLPPIGLKPAPINPELEHVAIANKLIAGIGSNKGWSGILKGNIPLPTATAPPTTPSLPSVGRETSPSEHYVSPLAKNDIVSVERTDQGKDYALKVGAPIRAIGPGRVTAIIPSWSEGQPLVAYEITDGSHKGQSVYVAEQINPTVKVGDRLTPGDVIAHYAPKGTGIETGWYTGAGPGGELAQHKEFDGSNPTKAGESFAKFLASLGTPT